MNFLPHSPGAGLQDFSSGGKKPPFLHPQECGLLSSCHQGWRGRKGCPWGGGWGIFPVGKGVQGVQSPDTRAVAWSAMWPQAVTLTSLCSLSPSGKRAARAPESGAGGRMAGAHTGRTPARPPVQVSSLWPLRDGVCTHSSSQPPC